MDQLDLLADQGLEQQKVDPDLENQLALRKKRIMNSTDVLNQDLGKEQFNQNHSRYAAALGGSDGDNLLNALNARNDKRNADFVSTLKRENALMAPVRESGDIRRLGSSYGQLAQTNLSNYKIAQQSQLNKQRVDMYRQQQANSFLAGALGIFGTILGGAIGARFGGK